MNKEHIEELINDIATGRASEEELSEVESALGRDESLASFAQFTKKVKGLADATPRVKAPSSFAAGVLAASKEASKSRVKQYCKEKETFRTVLAEFVPKSKVFGIAVAAHALLFVIAAFVVLSPAKGPRFNPVVEMKYSVDEAASARSSAMRCTLDVSDKGAINVSDFEISGFVYIAVSEESKSRMLLVFTQEQFNAQTPEVKDSCTPAFVNNSVLKLPPVLIKQGIGSASKVVFLKLNDRFEIWGEKSFSSYMKGHEARGVL